MFIERKAAAVKIARGGEIVLQIIRQFTHRFQKFSTDVAAHANILAHHSHIIVNI